MAQQSERGSEERQKETLVPVQRTQRKNRTALSLSALDDEAQLASRAAS